MPVLTALIQVIVETIKQQFIDVAEDKRKYLRFDFQRVWQERSNDNDSTEDKMISIREEFRKDFTVLTNYLRKDVRDSCYGDKVNQVLINYDGKLFGCTARDFVEENSIGELGEDGELIYNEEKLQRRSNSKFKKEVCKRCRIAPICGGGCKQKAFEMENIDSCSFNYSSEDKDRIVLDIFEYYISNSSNHLNNN